MKGSKKGKEGKKKKNNRQKQKKDWHFTPNAEGIQSLKFGRSMIRSVGPGKRLGILV